MTYHPELVSEQPLRMTRTKYLELNVEFDVVQTGRSRIRNERSLEVLGATRTSTEKKDPLAYIHFGKHFFRLRDPKIDIATKNSKQIFVRFLRFLYKFNTIQKYVRKTNGTIND